MGLGLFWKERGPSSSQYLGTIKKKLGIGGPSRKGIGHGGTLDPFAEGWLLVGWGEGSKFLGALKLSKSYIAEIYFGASTDTLDDTVPLEPWHQDLEMSPEKLREFLAAKVGPAMQMPPLYSAKKVDGKSSYDAIRKGVTLDLKSVPIEILEAEHLDLVREGPQVLKWTVRVKVSAGTYIRAFARDWGQELFGKPAILSRLARVGYGNFAEPLVKEDQILSDNAQLAPFFEFVADEKIHPRELTDKGHLLTGSEGVLRAAWLLESKRWRYFTTNPLGNE
jgi:tRNA pseudouridine55 synthase